LLFRFGNALKEVFLAKLEFPVHQRRGGAERVIEVIERNRRIIPVVTQGDARSVSSGD